MVNNLAVKDMKQSQIKSHKEKAAKVDNISNLGKSGESRRETC